MQVSKRVAVAAAVIAAAGVSIPTFAAATATNNKQDSGTGHSTCADGNLWWSPNVLWAPNHKLQTITINYQAPSDNQGDTTTITVGAITDNQIGTDGTEEAGSGQPTAQQGADWAGTGNSATSAEGQVATTTAQVRAERAGTDKNGRTYSIQLMCTEKDSTGTVQMDGTGMQTITVFVPHDSRKS